MLILFFPFLVLYFITQKIWFLYVALIVLGITLVGHVVGMIFGAIGSVVSSDTTHDLLKWVFVISAALIIFLIMKG